MSLDEKLTRVVARHAEIGHLMSDPGSMAGQDFVKMSKEYADLASVVEAINEWRGVTSEVQDLEAMIADEDSDNEMRMLAEKEWLEKKEKIPELEQIIKVLLLPKDEVDEKNAILEIRAGTGGDEAALFAADLFRMYQRYSEIMGWKFELVVTNEIGVGGFKEAIAKVTGRSVFARLKYESGVHRVQRVPTTESSGRIHTSAATVAVLPEVEDVDIHIEAKDLRVDVYRASGPGGQSVNTTDSAVRLTHLPTGIIVICQDEKSQHKNKAKAMTVMRARLYNAERSKLDSERADTRRSQVGSGDRSERIRTYNFPQGRVTDHRINLTMHKLDKVMDGDLNEIIVALTAEDQAAQLSEMV